MLFNKTIKDNSINIKAISGTKNSIKDKDKNIIFIFNKKQNFSSVIFLRQFSSIILKYHQKNVNIDLSSFIDNVPNKDILSLVTMILIRLDSFIEPSFNLKSKHVKTQANIIYHNKHAYFIKKSNTICKSFHLARQYQIMPANYLGIKDFVYGISNDLKHLKNKKLKIKISWDKDLAKEKCGLIQAVNKGSDESAALMIIEYFNTTQSSKIALIGKGIMMDTGGYELKPSKFMQGMNQDMTGASVVFGIIHALASINAKVNVIGVIPLAKNLINSKAMFVNDIYKACNGMSVEILSQDSEGRLILADALAYVNKKYKISKAITIATLTGLSAISFGDFLTPFWATKSMTRKLILEAGDLSGEGLISLPLFPEFFEIINKSSKLADCANSCSIREASNSLAAAFLKNFCPCDDFVHFDIAGTNEFKKHPINPLGLTIINLLSKLYNN